jgi:hypothetical protein
MGLLAMELLAVGERILLWLVVLVLLLFRIGHATWKNGISCNCVTVACILVWMRPCLNSCHMLIWCMQSCYPRPSLLGGRRLIWQPNA